MPFQSDMWYEKGEECELNKFGKRRIRTQVDRVKSFCFVGLNIIRIINQKKKKIWVCCIEPNKNNILIFDINIIYVQFECFTFSHLLSDWACLTTQSRSSLTN